MELLTRNNFEGWMQKLMERLDRQDELLLAMKAEGKQPTDVYKRQEYDDEERTYVNGRSSVFRVCAEIDKIVEVRY